MNGRGLKAPPAISEVAGELKQLSARLTALGDTLNELRVIDGTMLADPPRANSATRLRRAVALRTMLDLRLKVFGGRAPIFSDPPFDILLLLYRCTLEGRSLSVSGACTAGQLAPTTGLRWVGNLVDQGLMQRTADASDARRTYLTFTPEGLLLMNRYIDKLAL